MYMVKSERYIAAIGRRKSASAQVRYFPKGTGVVTVNGVELPKYFPHFELRERALAPFVLIKEAAKGDVSVLVKGGGKHGQAEAVALGLARALVKLDPTYKTTLKKVGLMTRDPREKERKKPGLKRARRAPQWSKR